MSKNLSDRNIVVMGIRNRWSIAWGAAQALYEQGANVIMTYLGEREKDGVEKLAGTIRASIYQCDISSDQEIEDLFSKIRDDYGVIHGIVHSIAFARSEDLADDFLYTSREGFAHAMDISVYSLIAVCKAAKELMTEGGGIITFSYMGAEKVFPGYNVMGVAKAALEASIRYLASNLGPSGITVNGISAGPIKTFSAKGIKNLGTILSTVEEKSPLRRNVTQNDIGEAVAFIIAAGGITGEIFHVDCGYNIMGI